MADFFSWFFCYPVRLRRLSTRALYASFGVELLAHVQSVFNCLFPRRVLYGLCRQTVDMTWIRRHCLSVTKTTKKEEVVSSWRACSLKLAQSGPTPSLLLSWCVYSFVLWCKYDWKVLCVISKCWFYICNCWMRQGFVLFEEIKPGLWHLCSRPHSTNIPMESFLWTVNKPCSHRICVPSDLEMATRRFADTQIQYVCLCNHNIMHLTLNWIPCDSHHTLKR